LFRYDRDEGAAKLFGTLRIAGFRELLFNEETVLRDTRDGLDDEHGFTQVLATEVETRLHSIVEEEKARERSARRDMTRRQRQRMNRSITRINELLERLTNQKWSVGGSRG